MVATLPKDSITLVNYANESKNISLESKYERSLLNPVTQPISALFVTVIGNCEILGNLSVNILL